MVSPASQFYFPHVLKDNLKNNINEEKFGHVKKYLLKIKMT